MSADPSAHNGPFSVLLSKGELRDPARGHRLVPYKIYYPAETPSNLIPVIFWSHGFGGNRDGAAFISRYLASYGYAVVHVTHIGTDSTLWEGKAGHPWDILKQTKVPRETTLARFGDIPFMLDQLPTLDLPVLPHLDFSSLGISGHSFGAMTTQVLAGQHFPDETGVLSSFRDPRFKAGILYSPVPVRHLVEDQVTDSQLYGPIALPLLYMTGTQDDSPIEPFDYTHRMAVHEYSNHPDKYLQILQDGDHMIYNGTRGKLGVNPNRERHETLIKVTARAFWDAFLKNDTTAKKWLDNGGAQAYMGQDGQFKTTQRD